MPKVNARQAAYLLGLAEGKTKLEAALEAGYAPSVARNAHHKIEGPGVRVEFQRIITAWVDPELIGQRIAEGLSAEETKFFQREGEVTDRRNVIAWETLTTRRTSIRSTYWGRRKTIKENR